MDIIVKTEFIKIFNLISTYLIGTWFKKDNTTANNVMSHFGGIE